MNIYLNIKNENEYSSSSPIIWSKSKLIHTKGDAYVGQWLDGRRDGYRVQVWVDGSRYEGNWKNDNQ